MNLLSSVEIPVEIFSIDATKYQFDSTLRKTITKQVVAKELNETLNTQNFDIIMGHLRETERNPSHYECIELLLIFIHTSKGSTKWTCLLRGFCDPVDQSAIQSTGQQHPIRQHADGGGIQTTQKRGWRLHGTYLS